MINASKEFKEKLKNGGTIANYADITLSDGTVLHLEPKDFMIGGCTIEDKTTDGKFGVGFTVGKTLTIRIANFEKNYSQYDFYQAVIRLYIAMLLDDGRIEKIRKGIYYATVPSTAGEIIEISAVDGMYKLDKDYSDSTTTYPATLQSIVSGICLDCGIPVGFTKFDNMNFTIQEKPEKVTYRQVLSYAAQIAGYNARIDNDGYMQLIWYNRSLLDRYNNYNGGDFKKYLQETLVNGGNFTDYSTRTILKGALFTDEIPEHIFTLKSLDLHTDDIQITGIKVVGENDKVVISGEEGYLIEISSNPFVNGQEGNVTNHLGSRMVGMAFRPFTAQVLDNPLYEPFDIVMISDINGNVYYSIINSISYVIGSYTQIACEVEDPIKNGSTYSSPAAQAVVEARKNTNKQISNYDKAVQNMNQLASNAMGFHTTYEDLSDGSRITYIHDKPTIEESKTVYKQTIDGFFISTDGGKNYTAGFDKNGNAIVNILYAIGIVCDWIRGGTLTLGGENNVNGWLKLLNSAGEEVVKADSDGLSVLKGIIKGTKISIGGISGILGEISSYNEDGSLLFDLTKNGLSFYNENRIEIGRFAIAGYSDPTIKGLSQMLEKSGSNISWYSQEGEDGGYSMKFMYNKSDNKLLLGAYLDTRYQDILFSDIARTHHYASGISISASKGNFIAIGEDGNEKLRVNGDEIILDTTNSRKVNCYNDLDLHGFSILQNSDERLKTNIEVSDVDALSFIDEIQMFSFDWIQNEEHEDLGFIAQQLEEINPNLIKVNEKDGHYSTKELKLIPYLVKAIQELNDKVSELQNQIERLNGIPDTYSIRKKSKKTKWSPTDYTEEEKITFANQLKPKDIDRTVATAEPIIVR